MARKIYRNPPIDEATCQFTLVEPLPWDQSTPGRLFERLKDRYPGMPQQQQLIQANLTPSASLPFPNLAIVQQERVVFLDDAGTARLSVGPNTVAVHRTRPYVGFDEELLPRIRTDIPELFGIFQVEARLSAVSARYVNRIVIDETDFELSDYFVYGVASSALPAAFDGKVTGFFYRTASTHVSRPESLALTFASMDAPKDSSAFILDLDLTRQLIDGADVDRAITDLVGLKTFENEIFESLITDKCRDLFK